MASTNMVQEYHYPLFSFHYSSEYVLFSSPISPNSNKKFARKFSSLFWWSDFTVIFTITAQHLNHGSQTELSYTSEMFSSTYSCFVTTTMSISLSAFKEWLAYIHRPEFCIENETSPVHWVSVNCSLSCQSLVCTSVRPVSLPASASVTFLSL